MFSNLNKDIKNIAVLINTAEFFNAEIINGKLCIDSIPIHERNCKRIIYFYEKDFNVIENAYLLDGIINHYDASYRSESPEHKFKVTLEDAHYHESPLLPTLYIDGTTVLHVTKEGMIQFNEFTNKVLFPTKVSENKSMISDWKTIKVFIP